MLRAELKKKPHAPPPPQRHDDLELVDDDEPIWADVTSTLPPLPEQDAPPPPTDGHYHSPSSSQRRSRALSLPPNPSGEVTKRKNLRSPTHRGRTAISDEPSPAKDEIHHSSDATVTKKKSRRGSDTSNESNSSATSPRIPHVSKKRDKGSKSSKSPTATPTGSSPPSSGSFLALSPRSVSSPLKTVAIPSAQDDRKNPIHHAVSTSSLSSSLPGKDRRGSDRRKRVGISVRLLSLQLGSFRPNSFLVGL